MSEPIKVGDLVVVVRTCCDWGMAGRWIFSVMAIERGFSPPWECDRCNTKMPLEPLVESDDTMLPMSWVKRIPPLDELEGVDEKETLHA